LKFEKEILSLLEKARRSIKASKVLFSEGDYDFAISRAYYAMFYCAEAVLLTKELRFKKHSGVIAMFGKEFVKTGLLPEKLHQYLIDAYSEREKGDYEALYLQSEDEARKIIERAEEFIFEIEKFLKEKGYKLKKES